MEDVLLYVDGQPNNIPAPTTPNPQPINTVLNLGVTVGGSHNFANRGAEALLDEVAVFSRVLSPGEIMELAMGATLGGDVLTGDFNGDGMIDMADFDNLAGNLGAHLDGPVTRQMGDINFSGTIDLDDFGQFKAAFPGALASATGVPEPASIGLGLLAMGALLPLLPWLHSV